MIEYSKTDYEHILNVVFYHRHLYVKSNTDKYIGYVEYDEDEKYYIFRPSRTAIKHQIKKFEEHFKNATKLEKGIAIETLDFIEWFMCNLKNLEKHPFDGVLPYFNIDKVTEDETYTYDRTYWIPIKESLPPLNEYVLLTVTYSDDVTIGKRWLDRNGEEKWFVQEGYTNAEREDILAWKPLPESYEEIEE